MREAGMSDAPVAQQHREWALRALNVTEALGDQPPEALHFLKTGSVAQEKLGELTAEERESYNLFVSTAQAFANFEFEIRTETDAALTKAKEHAQALDTNWDNFSRISLDALREALGLGADSSVHDMVECALRLRNALAAEDD